MDIGNEDPEWGAVEEEMQSTIRFSINFSPHPLKSYIFFTFMLDFNFPLLSLSRARYC